MPSQSVPLPSTQPLLNRYSIRHMLAIVTISAALAAVLRYLELESTKAYAMLLAPVALFVFCQVAGSVVRPVLGFCAAPIIRIGLPLLGVLALLTATDPLSIMAAISIAALWIPQLAVCETISDHYPRLVGGQIAPRRWWMKDAELILATVSLLLLAAVIAVWNYGLTGHIVGQGTAFGHHWFIVTTGDATEFQWQSGTFDDVDWQWTSGAGRAFPNAADEDWGFFGFVRYRIENSAKLRAPVWLYFLLLLAAPVKWLLFRMSRGGN